MNLCNSVGIHISNKKAYVIYTIKGNLQERINTLLCVIGIINGTIKINDRPLFSKLTFNK